MQSRFKFVADGPSAVRATLRSPPSCPPPLRRRRERPCSMSASISPAPESIAVSPSLVAETPYEWKCGIIKRINTDLYCHCNCEVGHLSNRPSPSATPWLPPPGCAAARRSYRMQANGMREKVSSNANLSAKYRRRRVSGVDCQQECQSV